MKINTTDNYIILNYNITAVFNHPKSSLYTKGTLMTCISQIINATWVEDNHNPLIQPPFPSPIIGDPTFLHPSQTPDGNWYLIAYSLLGIHAYTSKNGIAWTEIGKIDNKSIRPHIVKYDNSFYLLTERIIKVLPTPHSRIEIRQSLDLKTWGPPTAILEPQLPWHLEGTKFGTVGNPCLMVDNNGEFVLYYSAGLVFLSDCFFWEPKYIGIARSKDILTGYVPEQTPIIVPSYNDPYGNLGAGAIKVMAFEDGYAGFQNGIYWNTQTGHSGSAIRLLTSKNGLDWSIHSSEPIIKPGSGWKKSHVYALDIKAVNHQWVMYFNARDGWLFGKERIGRVTAQIA